MLTEAQEKAFIRGIRKQQAKILYKERHLFRSGVSNLKHNDSYWFISCSHVSIETIQLVNEDSLEYLNEKLRIEKDSLGPYDCNLILNFGTEQEDDQSHCSGCYCGSCGSYVPVAEISKKNFKFYSLEMVKLSIKSYIDYLLRDLRFKYTHQKEGKDTKRYMKIIEENM